jgi:hypothetical protein
MRAALLAIVAACGSTQAAPPPIANVATKSPVDAAGDAAPMGSAAIIAKMAQFSDEMCTCMDRACTDLVTEEIAQWGQEMAKSAGSEAKLSKEDMKQMTTITERLTKCVTAVMMNGTGSGSTP